MDKNQVILLVDDSKAYVSMMEYALGAAPLKATLRVALSGKEAIQYLDGADEFADRTKFPLPSLVLLDLKMPAVDGFGVIKWIRSHPVLRRLAVFVLSGSSHSSDVDRAFDEGANAFLLKPGSMSATVAMLCCLRDWLEYNQFSTLPTKQPSPQSAVD